MARQSTAARRYAEAAFQIAAAPARFQPLAHQADFVGHISPPKLPVGSVPDHAHHLPAEVGVAEDNARLRQCLSFPKLGAAFLVVTAKLGEWNHQAAGFACGP